MFATTTKSVSLLKSICGSLKSTNSIRMSSHFIYQPDKKSPVDGPTTKMNMFQAINNALDIALKEDDSAVIFGEDVGFGGVFRCSLNLQVSQIQFPNQMKIPYFMIFFYNGCSTKIELYLFVRRKSMVKIVSSIHRYANKG